jgi:exodeoxyribonuclease VII large subunit
MTSAFTPAGAKVLQVSELTQAVKGLLEEGFGAVWVAGEISNLARPPSGHLYLTLKDGQSQVRAVIWRGIALRLRFEPHDGMAVLARGRVTVYAPRGEYQLQIEELHPQGVGALELALQQLREKLSARGYFDARRKKPLPRLPRRIALVTSPTGAAVRDMLEILARRWPAAEVVVYPVRVQGDEAAAEVAAAIGHLNRLHADGALATDVMIVGRGGGSLEDLWAFNEEVVARAIFESHVPVVSAVGHETDVTIADLVADHRALTPTHAATAVVPDRAELLAGLRDTEARLHGSATRRIDVAKRRLADLAGRRAFRVPLDRVHDQERKLDDWTDRLRRAGQGRLQRGRERLEAAAGRLAALSPLNVLARGYSLTQTLDGALVRSSADLRAGDVVRTRLHRGSAVCRVEQVEDAATGPDQAGGDRA